MDFDTKYNLMKEGGYILAKILTDLTKEVKEGIPLNKIDELAEEMIRDNQAEPAFKNYKAPFASSAYPYAICVSVNEEIVHGYPLKNRYFKNGDVVKLDLGLKYKGFYVDAALTTYVGEIDELSLKLILTTKKALKNAIDVSLPNRTLGDIGWSIETTIEDEGFKAIKNLCGHDIGEYLHGELQVPNFGDPGKGRKIVPGMFFTIEPMATFSTEYATARDDYIYVTEDGKISTHFEETIVILESGNEVLTPLL
ncbi:MAG: type I methionyl aminopeptidase [Patescibacteria group bacterium]|nr:type I methionyl aminopeptidase [Patescibacteria group bacterium]